MSGPSDLHGDRRHRLLVVGFVYLEVFLPADAPPPAAGEEIFVDGLDLGVGGALNAASVAHALGTRTVLSFPSPRGPFAAVAREAAAELGVDCRPWPAGASPPISVVYNLPADRAFLSSADFGAFEECPPLPASSWILVAGLREARRLDRQLRASRERGGRVCVNASWAPEELEGLSDRDDLPWDLLILNDKEALRAVAVGSDPLESLAAAVPEVVITQAERGVVALMEDRRWQVPAAPAAKVVDAVGTGDAFCAGLLDARLRGAGPEAALARAARVAARVLAIRGGVVYDATLFDDLEA